MTAILKPRMTLVNGEIVMKDETPLQRAKRRHGKEFGVTAWPTGEGASFWTVDRVAELARQNEERRLKKGKRNAA